MASTKLIVLKSKEIIYTAIFLALIIILIVILTIMFKPKAENGKPGETAEPTTEATEVSYIPGTYNSTISLGESTISVMVTVDEESITDVSFENLNESVTTMYPLLETSMEDINTQLQYVSSIDDITYSNDTQYTTTVICNAIKNALADAEVK